MLKIPPAVSPAVRRAIRRFDNAAQTFAFLGSYAPEDHGDIRDEYDRSREFLERQIEREIQRAMDKVEIE